MQTATSAKIAYGFGERPKVSGIDSLRAVMNGILVQGPKAILANSSGTKSGLIP